MFLILSYYQNMSFFCNNVNIQALIFTNERVTVLVDKVNICITNKKVDSYLRGFSSFVSCTWKMFRTSVHELSFEKGIHIRLNMSIRNLM